MNNVSQIEESTNHSLKLNRAAETRRNSHQGREPFSAILSMVCCLIAAGFLCSGLLTEARFGTYHDDSIYVTTAKALAEGSGYRIISLPYQPSQTKYPPLYPALLSIIWRSYAHFPQNLKYMTLLSIVLTTGFLILTWAYLRKYDYATRWPAVIVLALTALNWRTLILATSIFSEMLFAFLSLVSLYLAEKYEKQSTRPAVGIALGLLTGMTFLTRSSGLALLIAVALYFTSRKRLRLSLLPLAIAILFVIGWASWCYINRTTSTTGNAAYYTSYIKDFDLILGSSGIVAKLGEVLRIVGENLIGAIVVSVPVVCLGLNYDSVASLNGPLLGFIVGLILFFFLVIVAGFVRHSRGGFRLLHYYVISYLALHLFWPYASYDRFLMCILPFLMLFLITELKVPISTLRAQQSSRFASKVVSGFVSIVLFLSVSFVLFNYVSGYSRIKASLTPVAENAAEDSRLIQWIDQNTSAADILICYRDPKYYLYTGRKAISFSWPKQGSSWEGQQALIRRMVSETGGRYLVLTSTDFNHDYDEQLQRETLRSLVDQSRDLFAPVFSTEPGGFIYRIETND